MCREIRVLGIGSIIRCFLGIVGMQGFCAFVNFPSLHNTLMLQSCTLFSE